MFWLFFIFVLVLASRPLAPKLAFAHPGEGRGKMSDFFSNIWVTLVAPLLVLFIGAIAATWNWPRIQRWIAARDLPATDASHFTIIVAELEDDDEKRSQTKHVIKALGDQFGAHTPTKAFEVIDYPKILKAGVGGPLDQRDKAAEQKGRAWLSEQNAHLLIWGSVAKADQVIRLRFLTTDNSIRGEKGYLLTETLELPSSFDGDFSEVLTGYVISLAESAFEARIPIVDVLRPFLSPMLNLSKERPATLGDNLWAKVCNAIGTVFVCFGEQSGERIYYEHAVNAYNNALQINKSDFPIYWATTKNNLGIALSKVSEISKGAQAIDLNQKSLKSMKESLQVYSKVKMPNEWAMVQNNMGAVLYSIGNQKIGKEKMAAYNSARDAFLQSLKVRTLSEAPELWAMTNHNLGTLLSTLGENTLGSKGVNILHQAKSAIEDALNIRTQSTAPLHWAMSIHNLGSVLSRLAQRSKGETRFLHLTNSLESYKNSLAVYNRNAMPTYWAATQIRIGIVQGQLGVICEGQLAIAHLNESIKCFEYALAYYCDRGLEDETTASRANLKRASRLLDMKRIE